MALYEPLADCLDEFKIFFTGKSGKTDIVEILEGSGSRRRQHEYWDMLAKWEKKKLTFVNPNSGREHIAEIDKVGCYYNDKENELQLDINFVINGKKIVSIFQENFYRY